MSQVTIRDVAREAGVSVSSVSRILRGGQGHVYPTETHERVREIANRVGYRPNVAARLLSQSTRTMIGMSVHFTEHPYLNRFLVAVHQELLKREYDPVFLDSEHLSSDSTIQPFPPPHMLAGLISLGVDLQEGWPVHYAGMREHMPIVAVQPVAAEAAKWVDVVHVDFVAAYTEAVEHLLNLGHRHIVYCGSLDNPNAIDRGKFEGWIQAASQLGVNTEKQIPWKVKPPQSSSDEDGVETPDFIYQPETVEAMEEVVKHLESFEQPVTAMICGSDEVALALQSFLQSRGKQLPKDLSMVGYDGISLGAYFHPGLTTIAPDYRQMAKTAVDRLLSLVQDFDPKAQASTIQIPVKPRLVVRSSTGPSGQ